MLKDLSNTYFTVESIIKKEDKNIIKKVGNFRVNVYEQMRDSFSDVIKSVTDIIGNSNYKIEYPVINNQMYVEIDVENILSGDDIEKIKSIDGFYFEFINNSNTSIVNIFLDCMKSNRIKESDWYDIKKDKQ